MKQLLPLALLISLRAIILCCSVDTLFNYVLIECSTKTQNKPTSQPMNKRKNFQKMLAPPPLPHPRRNIILKKCRAGTGGKPPVPSSFVVGSHRRHQSHVSGQGEGGIPHPRITLSNPWPCQAGSPVHMADFHLDVGAQQPPAAQPWPTSAPTRVPLQTPPPAPPLPLSSQRGREAGGGLSV